MGVVAAGVREFISFAAIFSAATAFGAISHLPGGAGVFELVVLWAFRGRASSDAVAAALIAYRGVYYALPLILSSALFASFELVVAARPRATAEDDRVARAAKRLSPVFIGALTFGVGVMLLVSGATPAFSHRLEILSLHVPLIVVEASSFLGGVVGVVMLFLARGLIDRRDGAWRLALALSVVSLAFSPLKGLAYVEVGFLSLLILLLMATRPQFHRPTSMLDQPFTPGWFVAVGVILLAAFGVLWLAFDGVDLRASGLMSNFAYDAQAPRALRALIGASVIAAGFGVASCSGADRFCAGAVRRGIGGGRRDRSRPGSRRGDAGADGRQEPHVLQLRPELPDVWQTGPQLGRPLRSHRPLDGARGVDPPFRQSRSRPRRTRRLLSDPRRKPATLPRRRPFGDEARGRGVDLAAHLPARRRRGLTSALCAQARRARRSDVEEIAPEGVSAALPMLQAISDEWLDERTGEEKGFSVAAFDPAFLNSQYIGLARAQGEPVAFVSVMETPARKGATVALMRHRTRVSPYAMEFLFVNTILAFKDRGFETLSLGVAPLSGVRPEPLSSGWHWIGAQIWKHGDRFYNFQGLRTFKSKFNPTWAPRYLAASGTVGPFVALADAAAMIARAPQPRYRVTSRRLSAVALTMVAALAASAARGEIIDGASFGEVRVVAPSGAPMRYVTIFSGADGWSAEDDRTLAALAREGALAVGVDTKAYLDNLAAHRNAVRPAECVDVFQDVEDLSRRVQGRHPSAIYNLPIIVGRGEGGALAYVALAQSPVATVSAAISLDPTASVGVSRALCRLDGFALAEDARRDLGPVAALQGEWRVDFVADADASARERVEALARSGTPVHRLAAPVGADRVGLASLVEGYVADAARSGVDALPLVELPAAKLSKVMAVFLSGDGGWRDLDKTIGEKLQARGVSVVGWDSLRYFWGRKRPIRPPSI